MPAAGRAVRPVAPAQAQQEAIAAQQADVQLATQISAALAAGDYKTAFTLGAGNKFGEALLTPQGYEALGGKPMTSEAEMSKYYGALASLPQNLALKYTNPIPGQMLGSGARMPTANAQANWTQGADLAFNLHGGNTNQGLELPNIAAYASRTPGKTFLDQYGVQLAEAAAAIATGGQSLWIQGLAGAAAGAGAASLTGQDPGKAALGGLAGGVAGGLTAPISSEVSDLVGGGTVGKVLGGAAAGASRGGLSSLVTGGNVATGLEIGAVGGAAGSAVGAAEGAAGVPAPVSGIVSGLASGAAKQAVAGGGSGGATSAPAGGNVASPNDPMMGAPTPVSGQLPDVTVTAPALPPTTPATPAAPAAAPDAGATGATAGGAGGTTPGWLSSLASTLGVDQNNLSAALTSAGLIAGGTAAATGAKNEQTALASKEAALGQPSITQAQNTLARAGGGTYNDLTQLSKNALDTATAQGTQLITAAAPMDQIAQTAFKNYSTGTLSAADQLTLDNYTAQARQQWLTSNPNNADAGARAAAFAQIDASAIQLKQQLLTAQLGVGNQEEAAWLAQTEAGQKAITDAQKQATTDLNNQMTIALTELGIGLQPAMDAIHSLMAADSQFATNITNLLTGVAKAYALATAKQATAAGGTAGGGPKVSLPGGGGGGFTTPAPGSGIPGAAPAPGAPPVLAPGAGGGPAIPPPVDTTPSPGTLPDNTLPGGMPDISGGTLPDIYSGSFGAPNDTGGAYTSYASYAGG